MKNNISEKIILDQLVDYANKLGAPDNTELSPEKFLVAVIDALTGEFTPTYTEESQKNAINCLSAFLEYYRISYSFAKEQLQKHIDASEPASGINYAMLNILTMAEKASLDYGNKHISPEFVLDAILHNSTRAIKRCFFSAKKSEKPINNATEFAVFTILMEQSKTACGNQDNCVTAEKFLWTVCDVLENGFRPEENSPSENIKKQFVKNLKLVLNHYDISPNILKIVITEYFNNKLNSPDDAEIMNNILHEAEKEAKSRGVQFISAELVLDCLLISPHPRHKILLDFHSRLKKELDKSNGTSNDNPIRKDVQNDFLRENQSVLFFEDDDEEIELSEEEKREIAYKEFKMQLSCAVAHSKDIQKNLSSVIFGQDNAINTFVSGYYQARVRELTGQKARKPYATFLFAGPPGVGKTFLAETIAQELKLPFMRFDMSEYCDKEACIDFCGSDKVFKNSKRGNFTSFVADNPKCVVLFDEIEKAHSTIINLFLQMLDAAVIRDTYTDEEISLEEVIMIFTTNAGKQLYEDTELGDFSTISRKVIIKALQDDVNPQTKVPYFPAAICSRFAAGNVVMFNHITPHNLLNIAKREIQNNMLNFTKESGINIGIDERIYAAILFAEGGNADARTIKSRANAIFNSELYELFRVVSLGSYDKNIQNIELIVISVDVPKDQPEIANLFEQQNKLKTLVFSSKHIANNLTENSSACDFLCAETINGANDIMRKNDISMVLIDINHGASEEDEDFLNIGDEESVARDFLKQLRQDDSSIPVYLLQTKEHTFSAEEKISFASQGIRGIISIDNNPTLKEQLIKICRSIHEQQSVLSLVKSNKVVSFETAQKLSDDGKRAEILLFDFKLKTAVDATDSNNILSNVSKPDVKFDKVIGAEDAKQELTYFVEYLKNPKKYIGTGVKVPKGVLLYGPPGTGKTMLAKAMAGESDITFICAEGNQFLKGTVGEGSRAIHDLFRTARKYAPAILFIDEIDAIAKERTGTGSAEDALTALLTEMDGFKNQTAKPVFVLAATNFDVESGGAKSLDPALMRRFDRRIYVDLPDRDDRIKYMTMKIKSNSTFDISDDLIENLAIRSTGMSLASIDSAFELSLRMAIRNKKTTVTDAVLEDAFETFNNGEKKNWNQNTLLRVARHESGHAVICYESGETPSYITVVPRGYHGGYMQHSTDESKHIFTKNELLARIRTSLGGRAAEIVYYGEDDGISTGASGDLLNATSLARHMVELYGMDESYGLTAFASQGEMNEETKMAVNKILVDEMNNAIEIIKANKQSIDKLTETLVNKNHLSGNEINEILKKKTM